jgi:anti-anti-sigma regulatory factor
LKDRPLASVWHADRTVVFLEGEADIISVDAVAATLTDEIASDDGNLVIDLSGALFSGAATIGAFERGRTVLPRRMIRLPIVTTVSFTAVGDPTAPTQHRAKRRVAPFTCAR